MIPSVRIGTDISSFGPRAGDPVPVKASLRGSLGSSQLGHHLRQQGHRQVRDLPALDDGFPSTLDWIEPPLSEVRARELRHPDEVVIRIVVTAEPDVRIRDLALQERLELDLAGVAAGLSGRRRENLEHRLIGEEAEDGLQSLGIPHGFQAIDHGQRIGFG